MYVTKSIHAFDITYICLKTITDGDGRTDYNFITYSNLDNNYIFHNRDLIFMMYLKLKIKMESSLFFCNLAIAIC